MSRFNIPFEEFIAGENILAGLDVYSSDLLVEGSIEIDKDLYLSIMLLNFSSSNVASALITA